MTIYIGTRTCINAMIEYQKNKIPEVGQVVNLSKRVFRPGECVHPVRSVKKIFKINWAIGLMLLTKDGQCIVGDSLSAVLRKYFDTDQFGIRKILFNYDSKYTTEDRVKIRPPEYGSILNCLNVGEKHVKMVNQATGGLLLVCMSDKNDYCFGKTAMVFEHYSKLGEFDMSLDTKNEIEAYYKSVNPEIEVKEKPKSKRGRKPKTESKVKAKAVKIHEVTKSKITHHSKKGWRDQFHKLSKQNKMMVLRYARSLAKVDESKSLTDLLLDYLMPKINSNAVEVLVKVLSDEQNGRPDKYNL